MLFTDFMYAIPTIIVAIIFILVAMIEYPIFTLGFLGAVLLGFLYSSGNAILFGGVSGATFGWLLSKLRKSNPVDEFHKRYLGI